jgi:hypothetical protein
VDCVGPGLIGVLLSFLGCGVLRSVLRHHKPVFAWSEVCFSIPTAKGLWDGKEKISHPFKGKFQVISNKCTKRWPSTSRFLFQAPSTTNGGFPIVLLSR